MRFKLTLFLLALNLVAFGAIIYLERQRDADDLVERAAVLSPVALESDRLVIEGSAIEERRVLEREGLGEWRLREPVEWRANSFAVNNILNALRFDATPVSFSVAEIERAGRGLADYGLEEPVLRLTFETEGESESLAVGAQTAVANRVYLLGPDEATIYVVGRELLDSLALGLSALRDPNIFTIPPFEVRGIQMRIARVGDLSVRLVREGETWRFEAPLAAEADSSMVNATLATLTALQAERFFPGDFSGETGLQNASLRLTLEGNNRRQTLLIGNALPEETGLKRYYARLDGASTVFSVLAQPFDVLIDAQESLRERGFMADLRPAAVSSVTIDNNGQVLRLQRRESGVWEIVRESEAGLQTTAADAERIATLLEQFAQLEAAAFVSDAPGESTLRDFGLLEPQWRVQFREKGSEEPLVLNLSGPRPAGEGETALFAQRADAPYVYQLPLRTARLLVTDPLAYRDRTLWRLPSGARITGLRIEETATGEARLDLSRNPDELWGVAIARLASEEAQTAAESLLEQLRAPEVKRYLADEFTGAFLAEDAVEIPWLFTLIVTVELPGGTDSAEREERSLFLTERLGGDFQAGGSPREEVVFSLEQAMIDALHPFLFEEAVPEDYTPTEAIEEPVEEAPEAEPEAEAEAVAPEAETEPTE